MDAEAIFDSLQQKVALLPGSRDVNDRPVIIVDANLPAHILNEHLTVVIRYLVSIFSADTRRRGFCVIVDAQRITWRATRTVLSLVTENIQTESSCLVVLRPEVFWDKRKVEHCTRSHKEDGNPAYIPVCRLHKYINVAHLPMELGGTWLYDHDAWLIDRLNIDKFVKLAENTVIEVEETRHQINQIKSSIECTTSWQDLCLRDEQRHHYTTTKDKVQTTLNSGYGLIEELEKRHIERQPYLLPVPHDILDTKDRMNRLIDIIQGKMTLVEEACLAMKKSINDAKEVQLLEEGVCQVTNWILGPGEMMLNSQQDVGYDVYSAEDLRRNHESLELQFREPYGHYAELLHKLDTLAEAGTHFPDDLTFQKDFMDFVCRSFATRVERRRNILITSARFFRLVTEYFQATSSVYENLVMSVNVEQLDSVHCTLSELQHCQSKIETLEKELVKEGEKLSDLLSMPVKDALGRELTVHYQDDIVNVQEILDMTVSRRQLFHDSVELQKLTLQQVAYIHSYESDAAQAIEWLNELYKVMLLSHCYIGCDIHEIQLQKEEHQCFQETAKGTFEFGCQLLTAALTLRQSCKLSETANSELTNNVWQSWNQLHTVSQEQLTRLRVSAVFHRSVDEHCEQLKQLLADVRSLETEMDEVNKCLQLKRILFNREKILLEVGRMVRLGKLLKSRLKEPISVDLENVHDNNNNNNEIAIEAVCAKLSKVSSLAQQLDDALCSSSQCAIEPAAADNDNSNNQKKKNKKKHLHGQVTTGKTSTQITSSVVLNKTLAVTTVAAKHSHEDSSRSDDDFHTASECTGTPPSRASSFHTASEDDPNATWWEVDPSPSDDTEHENYSPPSADSKLSSATLDESCCEQCEATSSEVAAVSIVEMIGGDAFVSPSSVAAATTFAAENDVVTIEQQKDNDHSDDGDVNCRRRVVFLEEATNFPVLDDDDEQSDSNDDDDDDTNSLLAVIPNATTIGKEQIINQLLPAATDVDTMIQLEQSQSVRNAGERSKVVRSISENLCRNKHIVKQAISGIF